MVLLVSLRWATTTVAFLLALALSPGSPGSVFPVVSGAAASPADVALAHYLKASNTRARDVFGRSVAMCANSATESTVVVGAYGEDSCSAGVDGNQTAFSYTSCSSSGAAYVFRCTSASTGGSSSSSSCRQLAYLKASNAGKDDDFGDSVAVSANSATESTVVIGAPTEDSCAKGVNGNETDDSCTESGSAYVFSCSSSPNGGACTQLAYLKASNTGANHFFGKGVAVTANSANVSTVVIGAPGEGSCATGSGGNQTAVDDGSCNFAGSAYVFSCGAATGGDTCAQVAYLKASNTGKEDYFGASLDVSANSATESTVVVSAMGEEGCATGVNGDQSGAPVCYGAGSAYVFSCSSSSGGGTSCSQLAYLKASNTGATDRFGHSVAVSANSANESTVVVGAYGEDSCATGVDGNQSNDSGSCDLSGAAYVFSCSPTSGGTCAQLAYLKASSVRGGGAAFGYSVAVSANTATESTVVVGADGEGSCATGVNGNQSDTPLCVKAGSAYVFSCSSSTGVGTACAQLAYLKASNTGASDRFGNSIAVSANSASESMVAVGAVNEDSCATGVDGNQSDTPFCYSAGSAYTFFASGLRSDSASVPWALALIVPVARTPAGATTGNSATATTGNSVTATISTTGVRIGSSLRADDNSSSLEAPVGAIIGVVGGLVLIVIVLLVAGILFLMRGRGSKADDNSLDEMQFSAKDDRGSADAARQQAFQGVTNHAQDGQLQAPRRCGQNNAHDHNTFCREAHDEVRQHVAQTES